MKVFIAVYQQTLAVVNALVTVAVSGWAAVIYQRSAGQGKVEAMQRLAGPVWDFGLYRPGFREFGCGVR